jgi:signal transduction histidine kinase
VPSQSANEVAARSWRSRLQRIMSRHPLIVDAALVLVIGLILAPRPGNHERDEQAGWIPLIFLIALLLPLVWRRKAPNVVFAVLATVALVQWNLHQLSEADVALLVAFYTVAAYRSRRSILLAATVMEIGAVLAALRFAPAGHVLGAWFLISGLVTAAGVIGYNMRTRRAYLAALEERAIRAELERDQQAQIAAAAERARIAREMHDVVAHHIAVMIALADGASYTAVRDPVQATEIMGKVSDTGRSALTEMRRLLGVMRDAGQQAQHAPQPRIADLDELLAGVRSAGLSARLTVTGATFVLPPSAEVAVFRIVQEALTNTLKHARASAAEVTLRYRADEIDLDIVDNGTEPLADPTTTRAVHGHGIVGMRERAAVFGGDIQAGPGEHGGWRVRATLSLGPAIQTSAA